MQRDTVAYAGTLLLVRAQPFFEALILTKLLSVEQFGQWSWATALYMGLVALSNGGISAAMLRYAAVYPTEGAALLRYGLGRMLIWAVRGSVGLFGVSFSVPEPVRYLVWMHVPGLWGFLLGEVVRSYLRARYENTVLLRWQVLSFGAGMLFLTLGASWGGLFGAAWMRVFQPLWQLGPILPLLRQALAAERKTYAGFERFGREALVGNLALEAIFLLPAWLIGWRTVDPALQAYWRWATLVPLNLRQLFGQAVMYLYPRWAQTNLSPKVLAWRYRLPLWTITLLTHGGAATWALFWEIYPGPAYEAARSYYLVSLGVGLIWSTEALLLPNLLSAHGRIADYRRVYLGGLLASLPLYGWAGHHLLLYLGGMALAGLVAAGYAHSRL